MIGVDDLVITYNGEIYNYIELREELKKQGYEFKMVMKGVENEAPEMDKSTKNVGNN